MTPFPDDDADDADGAAPDAALPAVEGVPASAGRRPRRAVSALLERPLSVAFIATLGVLGGLVLGSAIGSITTIIASIVLALFVALGLDPIVRLLEQRGLSRGAGMTIVFGVFVLLVVAVSVFVLPSALAQVGQFVRALPQAVADMQQADWFLALPADFQAAAATMIDEVAAALTEPETLALIGGGVLAAGVGVVSAVSAGFVVVALTLYFLAALSSMKHALYALAPARNRPKLTELTERVTASVGSSLLGAVTLSALNACVVLLLHLIIGLPYPALMAMIAFVITLVPIFGSVVFLVIGTLVALLSDATQALIFGICYLVYVQLEAYVITPRVLNRAISIPAALVLIAAMIGGTLMGVLGVLVALPVMASILLILREVVVPAQNLKA